MSSMQMCDVCGQVVEKPHFKMRVLRAEAGGESRDMKTVGLLDLHDKCMDSFRSWLTQQRAAAKEALK
jgi:hypothetical protein